MSVGAVFHKYCNLENHLVIYKNASETVESYSGLQTILDNKAFYTKDDFDHS